MLTGRLVRVRFARDQITPLYLDAGSDEWLGWAEELIVVFRERHGSSRGELQAELTELFAGEPNAVVPQGLAKLLEDRSEFETQTEVPPEELRDAVFRAAAQARREGGTFPRDRVLEEVGRPHALDAAGVEAGLFADLKSEQRLVRFDDTTPERLLQRYNVALAQAVLLKAVAVDVIVRGEEPRRFRQLLGRIKFHRLLCEARAGSEGAYHLRLDGPLSLFSATQKYGLQLALFLPSLLRCNNFELSADLRWGPERKPKRFRLTHELGLVSHQADTGMYRPVEVEMFADLFRKKVTDWELVDDAELIPAGDSFWVPDFRLVHRKSGAVVYLEILGFWRKSGIERLLEKLRGVDEAVLLAVSEQLRVEGAEDLPADVVRFRNMPSPEKVVAQAEEMLKRRKPRNSRHKRKERGQ